MLRRKRVLEGPRPVRAWVWAEQFIQDLRYALPDLRGNPTFASSSILTLAVAIGMNTAIFSVFNAVVLRPLGYPNADRLVWLSTTTNDARTGSRHGSGLCRLARARRGRSIGMVAYGTPTTRWYLREVRRASGRRW